MAWVSTRIICFPSGERSVYSHGKDRKFEEMAIKAFKRNHLLFPSVELVNMYILCSLLPLHYMILDYSCAKLEFVVFKAQCFFEFSSRPSYFALSSHTLIKPDYRGPSHPASLHLLLSFSFLSSVQTPPPQVISQAFFCCLHFNYTKSFEWEGCAASQSWR